jgi:non-specific serine/threonine protein kinase
VDRAEAYAALLADVERGADPGHEQVWYEELAARDDELGAALGWFHEQGDADAALRLATALRLFWMERGRFDEGRAALERAVAAPGAASSERRAGALAALGLIAFRQGDNERARGCLDESLALARGKGDRTVAALALNGLSRVALRDGDYGALQRFAEESKSIAEESGDRKALISPLHMLATAAKLEGNADEARRWYGETLALSSELGAEGTHAGELHNLGTLEKHEGNLERAEELFRESLVRSRAMGNGYLIPYGLLDFGDLAALHGDGTRAARLLAAAASAVVATGAVFDPDDQPEFDRAVALAKELAGADFAAAWAAGQALPLNDALDEALAN